MRARFLPPEKDTAVRQGVIDCMGGCKDEESNGVRAHVRQLAAQVAWMRGHPTDDVCPQRPDTVSRWEFQ